MQATTIAIVNQKGGTGKTTTSVNLGAALAQEGKRVLLMDMDPQGNLSFHYGVHQSEYTLTHVLSGEQPLSSVLQEREQLWVAPSDISLTNVEVWLNGKDNREFVLRELLEEAKTQYDYILIDCGPSLSALTVNALVAADRVLVPMQAEVLSLHGLSLIVDTVFDVKEAYNEELSILGILPVMLDRRRRVTGEVLEYLNENFGFRVMRSGIPVDVRIVEAPSFGKSIMAYAPQGAGGKAYALLAREVVSVIDGATRIVE